MGRVADLLSDPTKWTRKAHARTIGNDSCEWNDPAAIKWDIIGAIRKCYSAAKAEKVLLLISEYIRKELFVRETVAYYNDFMVSHRQLVDLLTELDI